MLWNLNKVLINYFRDYDFSCKSIHIFVPCKWSQENLIIASPKSSPSVLKCDKWSGWNPTITWINLWSLLFLVNSNCQVWIVWLILSICRTRLDPVALLLYFVNFVRSLWIKLQHTTKQLGRFLDEIRYRKPLQVSAEFGESTNTLH
jgi:hypothetical protein